jgi:hypothetical protein
LRRETQNGALYFQTFKIRILKFQKIQNKILEVANDVYYKRAKSQYKLLYIVLKHALFTIKFVRVI